MFKDRIRLDNHIHLVDAGFHYVKKMNHSAEEHERLGVLKTELSIRRCNLETYHTRTEQFFFHNKTNKIYLI